MYLNSSINIQLYYTRWIKLLLKHEHDNVQARKTSQTKPKGGCRTLETVDRYIRQQTKGHQTRVVWF